MKGVMSIIEVMITGIILIVAFLHFFPQYSIRTRWDTVLLRAKVRDALNTIDRLNKTYDFALNVDDFENFMNRTFRPEVEGGALVWWRTVEGLNVENEEIPYFTEGYRESMVDVLMNVLFQDDFEDVSGGWNVIDGTWTVENGLYNESASDNAISIVNNDTEDGIIIDVSFNETGSGSDRGVFIIFDYRDQNDFKFAGAKIDDDNWVIGYFDHGNWITKANKSSEILADNQYEMRVSIVNTTAFLVADNKEVNYTFSSMGTENLDQIGLAGHSNNALFDNFSIKEYKTYTFTLGLGYPY